MPQLVHSRSCRKSEVTSGLRIVADTQSVRTLRIVSVVALVSVGGYLAFLGWHRQKWLGADGYEHGPFHVWQVACLAVLLLSTAIWAGWRGQFVVAALTATVCLTAIWSADASHVQDPNLWPIGAVLLAVGILGGFLLVGLCASLTRGRLRL